MQIAGRFAVWLDFPGVLILESTTRVLWNMVRVRPKRLDILAEAPARVALIKAAIVIAFILAGGIAVLASMSKRTANDPAVMATPAPATGVAPKRETTTGQSIPPAEKQ